MIIALAGRRIDESETKTPRFPLQNVPLVKKRLKTLFIEHKAARIVCSAACGADLIALEAADELNLKLHIVLPFEPEIFLETSVNDRPGDWESLFKRIYSKAERVIILKSNNDDEEVYLEVNRRILEEAAALCNQRNSQQAIGQSSGNNVIAVIVWEGTSRGKDDITEKFALAAKTRNYKLAQILTK
ncbi:MAG TPA: hypothetical protein VF599_09200 [Pyrinomonadaceae bacterium]|jgi:hypothetical protein